MTISIHHIEIGVENGERSLRKFINQFKFCLTATRITNFSSQWVVEKGKARFLLTQLYPDVQGFDSKCQRDDYAYVWGQQKHLCMKTPLINSVFNVAIEVNDVQRCLNKVVAGGGILLKPLRSIHSPDGSAEIGMVKSCVGNVVHTLVNSTAYKGVFLPGFLPASTEVSCATNLTSDLINITHFDHITFACETRRSDTVLQWYEKCFGMRRFMINRDEDENNGFVVEHGDLGIRLMAFEYWKCAEIGLEMGSPDSDNGTIRFVIAESLHEKTPDQVNVFLKEHGGEGIQHIGLHTPNIIQTVSSLQKCGVTFTEPPFTYYSEVGKLNEIEEIGENVEELKKYGILLDKESDNLSVNESPRYLMQKFTEPLFSQRTFFLEVIQRVRATGFGAGNIIALWQSVQAFLTAGTKHRCSENQSS